MSGGWAHGGPVGGAAWSTGSQPLVNGSAVMFPPDSDELLITWDMVEGAFVGQVAGDYVVPGAGIRAPHAGLYVLDIRILVEPTDAADNGKRYRLTLGWDDVPTTALNPNSAGIDLVVIAWQGGTSVQHWTAWWVEAPAASGLWVPTVTATWLDSGSGAWTASVQAGQVVAWRQGIRVG